jgi:hypothetical protein
VFSCFALPDSFSPVTRASGPVFMFCTPELIFGDIDGVRSRFHVLRSRTRFRRYGGRRVSFSCVTIPDSFTAVPRASGYVFMFCAPELIFAGIDGVGCRFHVLRARTHFRRYRQRQVLFHVLLSRTRFRRCRGRRDSFSSFALPDTFSAVARASGPVCLFCTSGLDFGGTEGVRSCFHVLRARTLFRRNRRRLVPLLCFALPDMFSAVWRASGLVFMFCAPELIFGDNEGVMSRFYVLHARTHFRRYRGRRVPLSSFALPDSFSMIPRASGPIFMCCAPGLIFGSTEGVRS